MARLFSPHRPRPEKEAVVRRSVLEVRGYSDMCGLTMTLGKPLGPSIELISFKLTQFVHRFPLGRDHPYRLLT